MFRYQFIGSQWKKMPLTLVASGKNSPLTVVVKIPPLQAAKQIIGVMKLAPPSGVGPQNEQAP